MSLRLILILAGKDWRLFWADRRAALICFVVPIVLASAFGTVFDRPGQTKTAMKLSLAIVNESNDPAVAAFVNELLQSPRLEARSMSRAEAEAVVADRQPGVALILPNAFLVPKSLTAAKPRLELLHHPLSAQECQWAEGAVTEVMMKHVAHTAFGPLAMAEPPFHTTTTALHGPSFNAYAHSFNGMTLQYLLFWGMESGLLLLRERSRGVWRRLRTAPVSLTNILLGKAFATAGIALLQVLVTFTFGYFVFDVRIGGSFGGFLLLALAISALAAATGLLVATLGGTEARARSICILAILGVSMIGGLWLPAFLLPEWIRELSLALPTSWAMRGLDSVTWQSRDLMSILPHLAAVAGFAMLFLAVAFLRLLACEAKRKKGFGVG